MGGFLVEKMGFEPTTSCMPCKRSSQLSYIPMSDNRLIGLQRCKYVLVFANTP
jgi:hypothetical protein